MLYHNFFVQATELTPPKTLIQLNRIKNSPTNTNWKLPCSLPRITRL